jgi:GntR family transcriptional regulator
MVNLNYRDARPIYSQIVDGFREQIAAGILQPGDRMPSVRELATTLTINPNTIQRAYRELEYQGWIASVPGKGNFVCGVPLPTDTDVSAALAQLEEAAQRLLQLGLSREALAKHILEGGNDHA